MIAAAAHEANAAYCRGIGDDSQPTWAAAPQWQRDSAILGAQGALKGNTPQQSHEGWLAQKEADGWRYGPVKDPDKKEHPCFVPYADLSDAQQIKDEIFIRVVTSVAMALRAFANINADSVGVSDVD